MNQLDPESLHHFHFRQAVLRSNGVMLEIEEVCDNLVWLRVVTSPELHQVVSKKEVGDLAAEVFRFLPYKVFVTVVDWSCTD